MAVVRKITRRPVPLGTTNHENNNNIPEDAAKKEEEDQVVEKEVVKTVADSFPESNTNPAASPLNVNWEGWVSTISSIGSTLASKANQTIDQIYEIANASSPLELDPKGGKDRNASVDYLNDLQDLKNKLKQKPSPVITISPVDSTVAENVTEESVPVKGIQGKKPTATLNKKKGTETKSIQNETKSIETNMKPEKKMEKSGQAPKIDEAPSMIEAPRSEKLHDTQVVASAIGSIGNFSKTVMSKMSKARDLYAAPVVTYSSTEDIALPDLFTCFGGQAALTRLQLASSESARAYKKHLKGLKPAQSKALTTKAADVEAMFEPEHLMESVILLDESLMVYQMEGEDIGECLKRERKKSVLYARHHFAHLTALACQAIDPQKPPEASFSLITNIISELQLLLSQYEQQLSPESSNILLSDANECIKLLTEAAYQLVPIYKHSLINTN